MGMGISSSNGSNNKKSNFQRNDSTNFRKLHQSNRLRTKRNELSHGIIFDRIMRYSNILRVYSSDDHQIF